MLQLECLEFPGCGGGVLLGGWSEGGAVTGDGGARGLFGSGEELGGGGGRFGVEGERGAFGGSEIRDVLEKGRRG